MEKASAVTKREVSVNKQRAKEYALLLKTAIRTGEVDKTETAALVNAAKGNRSIRRFAECILVNPSSISRILNEQVTEINSELLAKIVAYAEPDSGVTIEKMMFAQGLVRSEDCIMQYQRYEAACRRIITDELLQRGYSVSYIKTPTLENGRTCDFRIKTDAFSPDEGEWLFECKMLSAYSNLPLGVGRTGIWLESAMAYYYSGKKAKRISLIVDHLDTFELMKAHLQEFCIPNEISVLYISLTQGRVLDEYVAPLTDGREPKKIFETDFEGIRNDLGSKEEQNAE